MKKNDWWKNSTVYQIYPKSFCDGNGDGIGDIKGIISKLDYLKELGVDVVWTTPMYVSPMKDNGYDIADYYNIDPSFGTMEEFEILISEMHKRGIKLIMDMVINHTSTEHRWFQEALKGPENKYHDYYIWKDGTLDSPPNNWSSKFGGNAWEYVEHLEKYYLHLFDVTQGDLNWENPHMREEIYEMIRFWLEKGVDGFRLDVINLISKNQSFPNDSYSCATADGRKFYTDGPRVHEFLKELTANTFDRYPGSLTVGEMSSTTIPHCIEYSKPENHEISMTFSFHHLKVDYPKGEKWALGELDFQSLKKILFEWQVEMERGKGWNALFWCNHDQPRIVSRFGNDKKYWKESAKMLGTTINLMRGTPYIYQGEELGMTNPNFDSIDEYRDVEAKNAYINLQKKGLEEKEIIDILAQKSRDNSRTPVQWSGEKNAGFTTGTPWIDIAKNYLEINAQSELEDKNSVFYHYRKLIQLRKDNKIISHGSFHPEFEDHSSVFGYARKWETDVLLVINNFYDKEIELEFPDYLQGLSGKIMITNYENSEERLLDRVEVKPYESIAIYFERDTVES